MGVETENPAALTDPGVIVCPKCSKVLSEDQPYCPVDHAVTGGVRGVTAGTLAHTPRSKQHLLGVTIGDAYVINGYLGSGGFGAVYRAEQKALGRDVAIKVLLVDPEIDPAVIQRFKREARTSAALLDPNIVTLFDYGETSLSDAGEEKDHLLYFVMELVHGPTLRQFLKTLPNGVGLDHSLKLGINMPIWPYSPKSKCIQSSPWILLVLPERKGVVTNLRSMPVPLTVVSMRHMDKGSPA